MGTLLITASVPLLPPALPSHSSTTSLTLASSPKTLVDWKLTQCTYPNCNLEQKITDSEGTKLSPILWKKWSQQLSTITISSMRYEKWPSVGLGTLLLHPAPTVPTKWQPTVTLPVRSLPAPHSSLISRDDLEIVKTYTQHKSMDVILRITQQPNIALQSSDLHALLTHRSPINQNSITLTLEVLYKTYNCKYVDPVFYPLLTTTGRDCLSRWFASSSTTKMKLNLWSYTILIPVHINKNHWIALMHKVDYANKVSFFYADDMNDDDDDSYTIIKFAVKNHTSNDFHPPTSVWIKCHSSTYLPHSNECGPRTLVAPAVLASHPHPHDRVLAPYMFGNLAQFCRYWTAKILLTGVLSLLSPSNNMQLHCKRTGQSQPFNLVCWPLIRVTEDASRDTCSTPPHSIPAIQSPMHTLIENLKTCSNTMTIPISTQLASASFLRSQQSQAKIPIVLQDRLTPKIPFTQQKCKTSRQLKPKLTQTTLTRTSSSSQLATMMDTTWGHSMDKIDGATYCA